MAIVGSITGIYDTSAGTPLTLTRPDVFEGATPKAALISYFQVNQGGGDYNTAAPGISYGYGAVAVQSGGDRQWAMGIQNTDAEASTDTAKAIKWGVAVVIPLNATSYNAEMTADLVANGITLTTAGTWSGTGDIVFEVTLIGGTDVSAYIPPTGLKTSQTRQGGIPFRPNLAMYGQCRVQNNDPDTSAILSQGFVFDNGVDTPVQRTRMLSYQNNQANAVGSSMIRNDCFSGTLFTTAFNNKMVHSNFDTDGGNFEHNFSTSSTLDFDGWGALYLRFDNEDVALVDIDLPRSTGSFTKDDYGFNPSVTKVWGDSSVQAFNTAYSDVNRAACPFEWTIEGSGKSVALYQDNASDPIDNNIRMVLGALHSIGDPDTDGYRGTGAVRAEGGFSAEFSQVSDLTLKTFSLALGTSRAATGLNINLGSTQVTKAYLGSTEISAAYLGSTSLGGGAYSTLYRDSAPAQDEEDWTPVLSTLSQESDGIRGTGTTAGLWNITLPITTEVGKSYRITYTKGAETFAPTAALLDSVDDASLVPTGFAADVPHTFTAIGTTTNLSLLGLGLGAYFTLASVLIEEMN
tara:strand:- start:16481 stop:18208 length:1728 start_codon:yes stop_codon:yes gene_type:complete